MNYLVKEGIYTKIAKYPENKNNKKTIWTFDMQME